MAAQEAILRLTAQKSLIAFTEYTEPNYQAAPHHILIAEHLEAVERGDIDRLMIMMPPRHGKSELASRRFPAWFLGRNRDKSIIAASYNSDLANDFGREVRNIVSGAEYKAVFEGVELRQDSKAANRWHTDVGGVYFASGVGTAVTGRGADVFLIDDPFKDSEEADSQLRRDRVWDWYGSTAYTRLAPGGRIVLIQTRWHEDDLAGRLLESQAKGGDTWVTLELPALNEDNDALWPDFYPVEALQRIRANIPARHWSALYQQSPAPEEGDYFKADWLKPYITAPDKATLRIYGASDYAVTDDGGDYTAHIVVGIDPENRMYLLDVWRRQAASDAWVEAFCDLVEEWKPIGWAEETGQIKSGVGPFLTRRMRERGTHVARDVFPTRGDKSVRAQSIRGRMALDGLYVPTTAPWYPAFEAELLSFPMGKHDDQVDALGLIGQLLDKMTSGRARPQDRPKKDRWDRAFDAADAGEELNWKAY